MVDLAGLCWDVTPDVASGHGTYLHCKAFGGMIPAHAYEAARLGHGDRQDS